MDVNISKLFIIARVQTRWHACVHVHMQTQAHMRKGRMLCTHRDKCTAAACAHVYMCALSVAVHWLHRKHTEPARCVGGLAICPTYAGRFSRNGDLSRRFADTHDAAASLRP